MLNRSPTKPSALRIGIDFGYKYTGISLLDGDNRVLAAQMVEQSTELSRVLFTRRTNRATRRREKSRRRRLRDFYRLMAEMDCQPLQIVPGDREAATKKQNPANQLYALVHRRGWDYADLIEQLLDEGGESPKATDTVKTVDRMLIEHDAPAELKPERTKKGKKENESNFAKRKNAYRQAEQRHKAGKTPTLADCRWLKIKRSCLGELAAIANEQHKCEKSFEKNPDDEACAEKLNQLRDDRSALEDKLNNMGVEKLHKWIGERVAWSFNDKITEDKRNRLRDKIMVELGLSDSKALFEKGEVYAPNRNQHRKTMLETFERQFQIVSAMPSVRRRAAAVTVHYGRSEEDVIDVWKKRAKKIINREYRKKRFNNRNVGKCPARLADGKRCNKNVPRRARLNIRRYFFEAEARQMQVEVGGEPRNLTDDEVRRLLDCVDTWNKEGGKINEASWEDFFSKYKVINKTEDDEKLRNKKDVLRDLVCGKQAGRASLCTEHIKERLHLIRTNATTSEAWANLHSERILDENDAPPSLRQKIDQICGVVKRLIKKAGCEGVPIAHIGIESARFDIHRLSAQEGRKVKKKKIAYSKPRGSNLSVLKNAQGGLCLYCGTSLGKGATVDHVFPRSRGGGNFYLNRVAACLLCNMEKSNNLGDGKINSQALENLEKYDSKKVAYIKKQLVDGHLPPSDNLAAPTMTMFGTKVLRGALQKALAIDEDKADNVFQKIRADICVKLRKEWFPFMHRQKTAIRVAADKNHKKEVGEEFKLKQDELKKQGILSAKRAFCEKHPGLGENLIVNGELAFTAGEEDVGTLWIRVEGECCRFYTLEKGEDKRVVNLGKCEVRDVHKDKDVDYEIDEKGSGWKKLIIKSLNNKKKRTVTVETDALALPVVICPTKNDPINKFHHIVDATVLAATVNWEEILRLARTPEYRSEYQNKAFKKALETVAPDLSGIAKERDDGDFCAPSLGDWQKIYRRSKSTYCTAKTKREPLRYKKGELLHCKKGVVSQRIPLHKLARSDIKRIVGRESDAKKIYDKAKKIYNELQVAWKELERYDSKSEEYKLFVRRDKNKEYINKVWFLQLPKDHFLCPNRQGAPRSVRVKNHKQSLLFKLKRGNAEHYFTREEYWGSVEIWESENGKKQAIRRRPSWYINTDNKEEFETSPPKDGRRVDVFKKGHSVYIAGGKKAGLLKGLWQVNKLDKRITIKETIIPVDAESQETAQMHSKGGGVNYCDLKHAKK